LQSAALVHEAYLCLIKQKPSEFENRAHFFAICAQLMRQILVRNPRPVPHEKPATISPKKFKFQTSTNIREA